jgi:hypothetical protein
MADELAKGFVPDGDRINTAKEQELAYWCEKWGVTRQQIFDCIKKVGASVPAIQKCLGK